jgi:cell division control protein 7
MEIEPVIYQEIRALEKSFDGLRDQYILLDKIGEGTFSSVYKAIDIHYQSYDNSGWDIDDDNGPPQKKQKLVALKKIYVTSSVTRIMNELKLLKSLEGSLHVTPLITALRSKDQVIAVLPYFEHIDFRVGNIIYILSYLLGKACI